MAPPFASAVVTVFTLLSVMVTVGAISSTSDNLSVNGLDTGSSEAPTSEA